MVDDRILGGVVEGEIDFIGEAEDIFYDDLNTERLYVLTKTKLYILDRNLDMVEAPIILGVDPNNFLCDFMAESYSKKN